MHQSLSYSKEVKTAVKKSFPSICASKIHIHDGKLPTKNVFFARGNTIISQKLNPVFFLLCCCVTPGGTQWDSQWRSLKRSLFECLNISNVRTKFEGYKWLKHKAATDCSLGTFINMFNLQFISHPMYRASY